MKDTLLNKIRLCPLVTEGSTESEKYILKVLCPVCGQPEAYIPKDNPSEIICNRKNKCGAKTSTADYLGIHKDIEKNYPSTKSDPNLPATAYLQTVRMLLVSLVGLVYIYFSDVRGLGCGAVMFPLGRMYCLAG